MDRFLLQCRRGNTAGLRKMPRDTDTQIGCRTILTALETKGESVTR